MRAPLELHVETARDLARSRADETVDGFRVLENKIVGTRRWSTDHELVVEVAETGELYGTIYSQAATEVQDERPFEYDGDKVKFDPYVSREELVVVYYKEKPE